MCRATPHYNGSRENREYGCKSVQAARGVRRRVSCHAASETRTRAQPTLYGCDGASDCSVDDTGRAAAEANLGHVDRQRHDLAAPATTAAHHHNKYWTSHVLRRMGVEH